MSNKAPDPTDIAVGANIKKIRKRLGMSQERLGERLGLTFQQVQKYEKGANRVSASKLVEIAYIFDVNISVLFDGIQLPFGDMPEPRTTSLAERIEALPSRDQHIIAALLDRLEQAQQVAA